jgi:hypothetical protein
MDGMFRNRFLSCVSSAAESEGEADDSPTDPVLAASVVKGVFAEVSLLFLPSEIKLM